MWQRRRRRQHKVTVLQLASPAPRTIHVTNGTLVISFARAYSSGIATVIVPELMRPAIISPHAYLAQNNPDFTVGPKVQPHCTSPAPRAIHVTNGTLAFAFTHAYPSGIATVIVPELMRPAYLAQDAPSTATPSASERGTCSNRVLAPQAKLVTYARTIY